MKVSQKQLALQLTYRISFMKRIFRYNKWLLPTFLENLIDLIKNRHKSFSDWSQQNREKDSHRQGSLILDLFEYCIYCIEIICISL